MNIKTQTTSKILERLIGHKQALQKGFHAYAFEICYNPFAMKNIFVRYTLADLTNPDQVKEEYVYQCFDMEGNKLECQPIFDDYKKETLFFDSMIVMQKHERL